MRERLSMQRGSISVEMGLAIPLLFLFLLGGVRLGRAVITRHRLEDAVAFAARASAVIDETDPGAIRKKVLDRLGAEQTLCVGGVNVTPQIIAQPDGAARALEVVAECTLAPLFETPSEAIPGIELRAVAAMPLPLN
jgi:hypothetical protein